MSTEAAPEFEIYEAPEFQKWVTKNCLPSAVERLKTELMANPDAGDVIPGGGGLRKIRMAGLGRGKRGGFRVVYVLVVSRTAAVLMDGYSKADKEDLSADELKALAKRAAGYDAIILAARQAKTQPEDNQ